MINKDLVKEKIDLIQIELSRLEEFKKFSFQDIVKDFRNQAIVERLLERIINRGVDINQHLIVELSTEKTETPKDYKKTFLKLAEFKIYPEDFAQRISQSVGTRNILVHEYDKVDYSKIYSSISDCLKDYMLYCDYIIKFLENLKS